MDCYDTILTVDLLSSEFIPQNQIYEASSPDVREECTDENDRKIH